MAKISCTLSTKQINGEYEVMMRFVGGRGCIYRLRSGVYVDKSHFRNGEIVLPRFKDGKYLNIQMAKSKLMEIEKEIIDFYAKSQEISKEDLLKLIRSLHENNNSNPKKPDHTEDFHYYFEKFLRLRKLAKEREEHYRVLIRAIKRFELFRYTNISFNLVDSYFLADFEGFLKTEHELYLLRPDIYEDFPKTKYPKSRGRNTVSGMMKKFRAFLTWAVKEDIITTNPFQKYSIKAEVYGTPYYITLEERDLIYNANLSYIPWLMAQRDIFVFQCLVGCRVGDLIKLKKQNVVNEILEYIPRKTIDGNPITVRVPLNKIAKEILKRYQNQNNTDMLFPFISLQKYNEAIKKIFTIVGLTRMVTVIKPSGEQELVPLNKIASSHIARRCFIGNLYKKVKDPNLISALSGHSEGSRAFSRYREIDEETKRNLVELLE